MFVKVRRVFYVFKEDRHKIPDIIYEIIDGADDEEFDEYVQKKRIGCFNEIRDENTLLTYSYVFSVDHSFLILLETTNEENQTILIQCDQHASNDFKMMLNQKIQAIQSQKDQNQYDQMLNDLIHSSINFIQTQDELGRICFILSEKNFDEDFEKLMTMSHDVKVDMKNIKVH